MEGAICILSGVSMLTCLKQYCTHKLPYVRLQKFESTLATELCLARFPCPTRILLYLPWCLQCPPLLVSGNSQQSLTLPVDVPFHSASILALFWEYFFFQMDTCHTGLRSPNDLGFICKNLISVTDLIIDTRR